MSRTLCLYVLLSSAVLLAAGCSGPEFVPVEGEVYYNQKKLEFGSVMFQPAKGQSARGEIQPDGSFSLSTPNKSDGASVGQNLVRVSATKAQAASAQEGEVPVGESVIPEKFRIYATSGLEVDVQPDMQQPVIIWLTDEGGEIHYGSPPEAPAEG